MDKGRRTLLKRASGWTKRIVGWMALMMTMVMTEATVFAGTSGITNPLAGTAGQKAATVSGTVNKTISWGLDAVKMVAMAWFLFQLYKTIMTFMSSSHSAQKREEARGHLIQVVIAGVLLGAAQIIGGALYNFGSTL